MTNRPASAPRASPPRLAQRLLHRVLDSPMADALVGDLDEIFADEARQSEPRARIRYWRRTAGALWHLRSRRRRPLPLTPAGDSTMSTMLRDFVRGSRLFVTHPSFAWAAVVTLALAIGANTLIFTLVNLLVLKPFPVHEPDRLGFILVTMPGASIDRAGVSLPEYAEFRDGTPAFSRLAAWRRETVTYRDGSTPERLLAQRVIGDLQGIWGLEAVRGRTLSAADERPNAPPVATLSHRFWQARYGSADAVLGTQVVIDGQVHEVVGVLAPEIELGNIAEVDVWLPTREDPTLGPRAERGWRPVGRLRDGLPLVEADAQVAAIAGRIEGGHPEINRDWQVRVGSSRQAMAGANVWVVLAMLGVVVSLLLLLACANVMNLLIARLLGRRQELAVRTALGATRGQVVRQIVSESLLLGVSGGLLGLAIAWGGLQVVYAVTTEPIFHQLAFDVRVVSFAAALSFLTPLLFSVLPAVRILRDDVRATLNEGSARSIGSGVGAARGRSGLVVFQVTLAVTLLIVAALIVQSVQAVIAADVGYDQSQLAVASIDVAPWHVPGELEALRLRQRVAARVRELPGVDGAALATEIPALHFASRVSFEIDGRAAVDERDRPRAGLTAVTAEYFDVTGIPVIMGRSFAPGDAAAARPVAIVSAEATRRYWPSPAAAIGSTIRIVESTRPAIEATIVGVARDAANPDLDQGPEPMLFLLDEHRPSRAMTLLVRTANPAAIVPLLRTAVAEVSPDLPAYRVQTLLDAMEDEFSSNRLIGGLFAAFAVVAVLLAMAGLYGVMSYAVSQRSGEIAVRMALGAPARAIAGEVVGQSLRLAAIGVVLGMLAAYGLARAIESMLYGVAAADPVTYAGALALTTAAALAASWLPMRRAAGIDPIESLRHRG